MWVLLVCLAALGWGGLLARRLPGRSEADRLGLGFGLGLLLLSLGASACLMAGWMRMGFPALAVLGALLALRPPPALSMPRGPDLACLAWLLLALLVALAPVTDVDSTVYHFSLPRDYVAAGRLLWRPDIPNAGLPEGGEALWTLAFWGGGERAAALLGVVVMAALAGTAGWAAGAVWGLRETGWVRLAAFASGSFVTGAGSGAVEPLLGLALLLTISLGTLALKGGGSLLWGSAALTAGAALGIKPTVLCFLPPFAVLGLLAAPDRGARIRLLGAGLAALLLGIPWYVRTAALTGNPLYPHACPFLPSLPREIAMWTSPLLARDPGRWGHEAGRALLWEAGLFLAVFGTLAAADRRARAWGAALLAGLAILLLEMRFEAGRYASALLPTAAVAWSAVAGRRSRILGALACAGLALLGGRAAPRLETLGDPGRREAFLEARVGVAGAARFCRGLETGPGTLILAGEQVLPFPPGTLAFADYAQNVIHPDALKDPETLRAALKAKGIRFLAVDRTRHGRGLHVAEGLLPKGNPATGFRLIYDDPNASVYALD